MVKVLWTDMARDDLKSIFEYISEDSSFYAKRFAEKLLVKVEVLAEFPKMGRIVPEFETHEIRELIEGNYRIVYKVFDDRVDVLRIHHSSRQLK